MTRHLIGRRAAVAGTLGGIVAAHSRIARAADPIKIGFSIPQSGGLAAIGKQALLAIQIWADDVNAKGGIIGRPVQLVTYDDQSSPANVPPIYTKLLDVDKVDLIVTNGTNLTVPAMPIAMQRGKVVFCMLALAINDKFKYPRFFQTMPYGPHGKASISEGFFDVAMGMKPAPTTVALVGADAEFSKSAVEGARDEAKKRGLKVVYDRTYPPSTVDFGPVIRGIATANPDLVYVGSYPVDTSGLIRAARELNFSPKLFGGGMVGTQAASLQGDLGDMLNDVVSYELYCPAVADKFPEVDAIAEEVPAARQGKGHRPARLLRAALRLLHHADPRPGGDGHRRPRPGQDGQVPARQHLQDHRRRREVRARRRVGPWRACSPCSSAASRARAWSSSPAPRPRSSCIPPNTEPASCATRWGPPSNEHPRTRH